AGNLLDVALRKGGKPQRHGGVSCRLAGSILPERDACAAAFVASSLHGWIRLHDAEDVALGILGEGMPTRGMSSLPRLEKRKVDSAAGPEKRNQVGQLPGAVLVEPGGHDRHGRSGATAR